MSETKSHGGGIAFGALKRGLGEGVAGFLFSVFVSVAIVGGLFFGLGISKLVDRWGLDMSFRLAAQAPHWTDREASMAASRPAFAFIDIDAAACEKFSRAAPDACETQNPVSVAYLGAFADSTRATNLKVVLLDTELDLGRPEDRALVEHLMASTQTAPGGVADMPWFIVPLRVRPLNPPERAGGKGQAGDRVVAYRAVDDLWFDEAWLTANRFSTSKVRFAPFVLSTDAEARDGVVRNYQPTVSVHTHDDVRLVPTAPYLAARLAYPGKGGTADMDCVFYAIGCTQARKARLQQAEPAIDADPQRIAYTLPALSRSTDEMARRFEAIYVRSAASRLLDGERFNYSLFDSRGAVVAIVGSSLRSAGDLHLTPLGLMSGPEIIINATRSQAEFGGAQVPRHEGWRVRVSRHAALLGEKVRSAVIPALITVLAFFGINVVDALASRRWPRWKPNAWPKAALSIVVAALVLVLCFFLELTQAITSLYTEMQHGRFVDTLTPLLALWLELYTNIARGFFQAVEWTIERTARFFEVLGASILRLFGKGAKGRMP